MPWVYPVTTMTITRRYMAQLGLQKRAKTLPDLSTYLSNGKEREESKQKIEQ